MTGEFVAHFRNTRITELEAELGRLRALASDAIVAARAARAAAYEPEDIYARVIEERLGSFVTFTTETGHDGLTAEHDAQTELHRLRAVASAAHELLDEDRTSWSPEHARLLDALVAVDEIGTSGQ